MDSYSFPVGRIVGFHGLRGEVKIRPETNNPDLLLSVTDVEIAIPQGNRIKAEVENLRYDKRLLFVKFQSYPDRTSVEPFMNASVFTTRDQLENLSEDEWWVDDLIGLNVYTTEGKLIGTVCGVIGANGDLLEVAKIGNQKETCLIPFVSALVPLVDPAGKRVEVVDLPGLFD